MTDPRFITDRAREKCQAELTAYVEAASQIPVFGDSQIDFHGDWKVFLRDRARPRNTIAFRFSQLHGDLSNFSRSYISRLQNSNGIKPHAGSTHFKIFKFLSQAMKELACDSVVDLTPAIFSHAQIIIEEYGYNDDTVANYCNYLQRISRELVTSSISLVEFDWTHPHRSRNSSDVFSQEARAREKRLLPARHSLQALADMRPLIEEELRSGNNRARFDLVIYWIVILIFATGLRANEVISLKHKFLLKREVIDGERNANFVYFIRRKTSKGGPSDAKPLSPVSALLCRKAQRYLKLLTHPAHKTLQSYFIDHDTSPDWSRQRNILLTPVSIREYLSIESLNAIYLLFKKIGVNGVISLHDLRRYLNGRQEEILKGYNSEDIKDGYFPIMTFWPGKTAPRLGGRVIRFIEYADVRNFLAGNGREVKSAFVRYLNKEHYLATHQFRRLLDTSVREGGISENELAILQGRASPAQNAVYDYRTPDERARDVKEAIRNGDAFGWAAGTYRALPIDEREEFLDSVVQVAYRTSVGHCLTNISEDPCPYHLQCLSGCGDYLHIKGDEIALKGLADHKKWASSVLDRLAETEPFASEPAPGLQNHRSHLNRQITTVDKVLAIEASPEVDSGETIRVYPNRETFAEDPDKW